MFPKIGIFLFGLFPFYSVSQTCVIAKRTATAIYVGADSRLFETALDTYTGKLDTVLKSICKIHNVGKFNFAVVGYFAPTSTFIASEKCKQYNSFSSVMEAYISDYGQKIADSLPIYKKYNRGIFDYIYRIGTISEIIFFGYEHGKPILTKLSFYIKNYSDVDVAYDSSVNIRVVACGHYDEIKGEIARDSTWPKNPTNTIRRLIEIEAKVDSLHVGGNIDIIKITDIKPVWISKKNSCPISDL